MTEPELGSELFAPNARPKPQVSIRRPSSGTSQAEEHCVTSWTGPVAEPSGERFFAGC